MEKNILPEKVAEKYQALIEPTRIRFQKPINREIDLRSMSLEDAALIAQHHPEMLVKTTEPAKAETPAKSAK